MDKNNRKFNLQIQDTHNAVSNILSNSNLPIGIVYYIVKDIYNDLEYLYQQQILIEQQDQQEEESSLDESDS